MTMRSLLVVCVVTLLAVLLLGRLETWADERRMDIAAQQERAALLALLPATLRAPDLQVEWRQAEPKLGATQPWGLLHSAQGELLARITTGVAQGYGGELRVQQLSDVAGRPLGWRLVSHQETPAYLGAPATQWQTQARAEDPIDQISGASLSTRALAAAREQAAMQARQLAESMESTTP